MALVKCPNCEAEISEKARKCPECSYVIRKNKVRKIITITLSIILFATLIFGTLMGIQIYKKSKVINAYDESVCDAVNDFYETIKEAHKLTKNNEYTFMSDIINELKEQFIAFDDLPVNMDSKIGVYIDNVKNHDKYLYFFICFVHNSDDIDYDYNRIIRSGYADIICRVTEEILSVEPPILNK